MRNKGLCRHHIRNDDHERPAILQGTPDFVNQRPGLVCVLEHVETEDDVVLLALELNSLQIHDPVLVGIGPAPTLSLDDVDSDDIARPPDLEAGVAGLDVEDPQHASTRKKRVDEKLCLRELGDRPAAGTAVLR
jgi:hypothetical protein